jgi:hypothetical protein
MASRAEHSLSPWNPVVATFPGANTIGDFPKSIKVSALNGAKTDTTVHCYKVLQHFYIEQ